MPLDVSDVGPGQTALNFKAYTDALVAVPVALSQNLVSHSKRMDILAEQGVAVWINRLSSADPVEAISTKQMLTGHAGQDHLSAIGLGMQMVKAGQTTPPVTGYAPVTGG